MTTSVKHVPPAGQQPVLRQFDRQRPWELSQPVFEQAVKMLAEAASPAKIVIGIARGGVPLAELIASRLGMPTVPLRARHNLCDDIYLQASGDVRIAAEETARHSPRYSRTRIVRT